MSAWHKLGYVYIIAAAGLGRVVGEPTSLAAVVDLTKEADIFDDLVQDGNHTPWFVKFYAPWCSHCTAMAPLWEQVAKNLMGKVRVAKVDCTVARNLASDFDIDGYPTLKLISKGKVYEFDDSTGVDLNSLSNWAKKGFKRLHKEGKYKLMPRDKSWAKQVWSRIDEYFVIYVLPVLTVIAVLACLWTVFGPESAEEKKRKAKWIEDLKEAQINQKRWEEQEKNVRMIKLNATEGKIKATLKGQLLETYELCPDLLLRQIRDEMQELYPDNVIRLINTMGRALHEKHDDLILANETDFANIPVEDVLGGLGRVNVNVKPEEEKSKAKVKPEETKKAA